MIEFSDDVNTGTGGGSSAALGSSLSSSINGVARGGDGNGGEGDAAAVAGDGAGGGGHGADRAEVGQIDAMLSRIQTLQDDNADLRRTQVQHYQWSICTLRVVPTHHS